MATILVTGAAGFLGSRLCLILLQKGHHVIGVDNFFTGIKDNLRSSFHFPFFKFIEHDILQPIFLDEKIDQVYHLACPASPIQYQKNPIYTLQTAVLGTLNVLKFSKEKEAVFLLASTSEVYGDPQEHPQSESYFGYVNPVGPRSCYDEGKRAAETLTMDFYRKHYLSIRIVRIFNTYGPGMALDDGRVMSNLIIQALKGNPLTIYGQGSQTRSFCFVDDLINGLILIMNKNEMGPINLGNPEEYTMLEIAKKIQEMTSSQSQISFHPLPDDDPKKRKPNISRAISLGFMPSISLEEGLKLTIMFFKDKLGLN